MANISNIVINGVSYSYDKEMVSGLADKFLIRGKENRRLAPQLTGWIMGMEATRFYGKRPTQPTQPTQPTEPTEPTQPTQPTEPTDVYRKLCFLDGQGDWIATYALAYKEPETKKTTINISESAGNQMPWCKSITKWCFIPPNKNMLKTKNSGFFVAWNEEKIEGKDSHRLFFIWSKDGKNWKKMKCYSGDKEIKSFSNYISGNHIENAESLTWDQLNEQGFYIDPDIEDGKAGTGNNYPNNNHYSNGWGIQTSKPNGDPAQACLYNNHIISLTLFRYANTSEKQFSYLNNKPIIIMISNNNEDNDDNDFIDSNGEPCFFVMIHTGVSDLYYTDKQMKIVNGEITSGIYNVENAESVENTLGIKMKFDQNNNFAGYIPEENSAYTGSIY